MTRIEQQRICVALACLTGDRTKQEQKALLSEAKRIDSARNKISLSNPRAAKVVHCPGWWNAYEPPQGLPVWDRDSPEARAASSADNPNTHPKGCICRRTNLIPADGLSQLEAYVIESWEPSE